MGAVPIDGKAFWKSLPEEIREQFPPRVTRVVIDISSTRPVRVLYEAYGTEEFTRPLVEAVLRADVEIIEASPSIVEIPKDATLVIHAPSGMTQQSYDDIRKHAMEVFNHSRVTVLGHGISLEVVRAEDEISQASLVETIAAMPIEKRKDFIVDLHDEICLECGGDGGWRCTCTMDD